jgi:hypothetical protein
MYIFVISHQIPCVHNASLTERQRVYRRPATFIEVFFEGLPCSRDGMQDARRDALVSLEQLNSLFVHGYGKGEGRCSIGGK